MRPRRFLRPLLLFAVLVAGLLPVVASASTTVRISAIVRLPDGSLGTEEHTVPRTDVDAAVADLLAEDRVLAAGPVHERSLVTTPAGTSPMVNDPLAASQWGRRRLGGDRLGELGDGAGLVVAVLDTGVDASHPELSNRVLPGWDSMDPTGDGRRDPNGHGTHVAGIIAAASDNAEGVAGVAPSVSILPVRVLDASGNGDDDELALGIIWAVDNGADILNLSIGGAIPSTLLEGAIDHALANGVLVVVAAGNDGATGNEPSYPAAYRQVLAVGATDSSDRRSIFSNTGGYVDIAAPGSWIVSTWPGGRYQTSSGTSMAAPFVAGSAALVQSRTGLQGNELATRLIAGAIDLGASGRDDEFGAGLVNPLATIGVVPEPIPAGERSPVLPGLPQLPELPPLPEVVMPELPPLPPLTPPSLPPLVRPTPPSLPALPSPGVSAPPRPESPTTPGGTVPPASTPPGARDVRQSVKVSLGGAIRRSGGAQEFTVSLEGPRALVVRQRLIITVGSYRREVVTDWSGTARVRLPGSLTGTLRVEFPGSTAVRPAFAERRLGRSSASS